MKRDILKKADYRYDFDRDMYFNRATKKAFGLEFVADTPEQDLARYIEEPLNPKGWTIYFNSPPSESVHRELERFLDK